MADWWELEVDRVEDEHAQDRTKTLGVRARALADARHRLVKQYIWERVGPPLWIQGLYPVTISSVDTRAKTVSCQLEEESLPAVPYRDGPPPRVGEVWPLRRARDRAGKTYDWIRTYGGMVLYYQGRDRKIRRLDWPPDAENLAVTEVMTVPSGFGWIGTLAGPKFVFTQVGPQTVRFDDSDRRAITAVTVEVHDPAESTVVGGDMDLGVPLLALLAWAPNPDGADITGLVMTAEGGNFSRNFITGYVPGTNPAQPIWEIGPAPDGRQTRMVGIRATLGGTWTTQMVTLGLVHIPIDRVRFRGVTRPEDTWGVGCGAWTVREDDLARLGRDGEEIAAYAFAVNPSPFRGTVDLPQGSQHYHTRLMVSIAGSGLQEVPNAAAFPTISSNQAVLVAGGTGAGRIYHTWESTGNNLRPTSIGAWYDFGTGQAGRLPRQVVKAAWRDGEQLIVQNEEVADDEQPAPQYTIDGGGTWDDLPHLPGLSTDPLYFLRGDFVEEG